MLVFHWGLGFSWGWGMVDEVLLCDSVVSDNSIFHLLLGKKANQQINAKNPHHSKQCLVWLSLPGHVVSWDRDQELAGIIQTSLVILRHPL